MYNHAYYEACDLLMGISKQTVNINKIVLGDKAKNKLFKYVPHGLDHNEYKPLDSNDAGLRKFKKDFLNGENPDFVLFFNSRNIRRKQIPDAMLAFRAFLDSLPKEKADKCKFILHTEIRSDHGTDLRKYY
jgi:glycosyltransferase involved in cell wall biosynthesis